jgi:hypothetical protein
MSLLSNLTAPRPAEPLAAAEPIARRAVGARGRALFLHLHLWRFANQPWLERFYWYCLKPIAAAALILWFTPIYALPVRRRFGVPISEQIVQQCRLGFRDWVNPRCYYFHEHYRHRRTVDCAAYVMRHEIKEGLLRALHKLRPKAHRRRIHLGHKLNFARACTGFGLPTPSVAAVACNGQVTVLDHAALTGDIFLKPELGRGAMGAHAFHRRPDGMFAHGDEAVPLSGLLLQIGRETGRAPRLLQPLLRNHPALADLAEQSLLTIRLITCFAPDGRAVVTHAMLRCLSKLEPDWLGGEEYAAPIEIETGRLGKMCGDTAIGPQHWYDVHPVTGARVTGRVMPRWPEIHGLALRAHQAFADRMIVGWDVALTPDGPTLLEGNSYPDTEFLQRVHRQAIGDSPLGPLLAHHFDQLEERLA